MGDNDNGDASCQTNLSGQDEETETDGEMRHQQRGQQDGLDCPLAMELVAVERKCKASADNQRNCRRPDSDSEPVPQAILKILVGQCFREPTQRNLLGWKGQNRLGVKRSDGDNQRGQYEKT